MPLNLPSKASAGPQCAMLGLAHTALDLLHCNNVGPGSQLLLQLFYWFAVFKKV